MAGLLAGQSSNTYTPPQLFAGDGDVRTLTGTFASGLNLAANAVIARVAASGNIVQWAPAGNDGSQYAIGITCEAVNTTGGAAAHPFYISGDFNIDALVWPGGATAAQKAGAFDRTPITTRTLG